MRFHVNPERGPMRCSAKDVKNCKYASESWEHFDNKAEANEAYVSHQAAIHREDLVLSRKLTNPSRNLDEKLKKLDDHLSRCSLDELVAVVDSSERNYRAVDGLVSYRAKNTPAAFEKFRNLDPALNPESPMTVGCYTVLKSDWSRYRNTTAMMVEALGRSKFYVPATVDLSDDAPLGYAIPVAAYDHSDPRWYTSRFNTIGGSDVAELVKVDFATPNALSKLRKIEASKISPYTPEEIEYQQNVSLNFQSGALYHGTVWEGRIRDDFAREHSKDMNVLLSKGQYAHPERSWQRINVDGVLADKDNNPTGILEIKTGTHVSDWEQGVPLGYRAQTLYYLNATGLERAKVRALVNDGQVFEHDLVRDDEVAPGTGITMERYVKERVGPWFESLVDQRKESL